MRIIILTAFLPSLLPLPRRLCNRLVCLFVCLSDCLSVSNFAQKLPNGFAWNFQGRSAMGHWVSEQMIKLVATLWWFTAAPKNPKIEVFGGHPAPRGRTSHSPYILGDTTRPGRVTLCPSLIEIGRRRLRKTLHKQTNRQTDTTKIMVTWPW